MKRAPLPPVPEGSVRIICKYCRKLHIVKKGEYYTCPDSCKSGYGGYYIAVDKNGKKLQTGDFENIKIFLGLPKFPK